MTYFLEVILLANTVLKYKHPEMPRPHYSKALEKRLLKKTEAMRETEAINWLPSSIEEPKGFSHTVKLAKEFESLWALLFF